LGPGWIAEVFTRTVHANTAQRVVAVASRTPGKAAAFAAAEGIESHYASYEELVARDDIDAIYVATYPSQHKTHAMLAIAAGKHVLIEKPITMNAIEAEEIFTASRIARVFAMEAMWTRYLPQFDIARQLLSRGDLGTIDLVTSTFCQDNRATMPRMWQKSGGSPVFDMGIYAIAFAQQFLGNPSEVLAHGVVRPDGIEEEAHVFMTYESGARANLVISGRAALPHVGAVSGSDRVLEFGTPFVIPSSLTLMDTTFNPAGQTWRDETEIVGHEGLSYQVNHFAHYVGEGRAESPVHSHEDTVANIRVAQEIVALIGADPY
jgi:predicted dehydrogenase